MDAAQQTLHEIAGARSLWRIPPSTPSGAALELIIWRGMAPSSKNQMAVSSTCSGRMRLTPAAAVLAPSSRVIDFIAVVDDLIATPRKWPGNDLDRLSPPPGSWPTLQRPPLSSCNASRASWPFSPGACRRTSLAATLPAGVLPGGPLAAGLQQGTAPDYPCGAPDCRACVGELVPCPQEDGQEVLTAGLPSRSPAVQQLFRAVAAEGLLQSGCTVEPFKLARASRPERLRLPGPVPRPSVWNAGASPSMPAAAAPYLLSGLGVGGRLGDQIGASPHRSWIRVYPARQPTAVQARHVPLISTLEARSSSPALTWLSSASDLAAEEIGSCWRSSTAGCG